MHDIDEIIVIGGAGSYDENDELNPVDLGHGNTLYSKDEASLSAYALLQYRIAKYADELPADLEKEDARLPGEVRERLTGFIRRFHEKTPELKDVKPNRLFDALSQNDRIRENFWSELFEACPEYRDDPGPCRRWVKNCLYAELKPSAKMELLPINEKVCLQFITEAEMEDGEQWIDSAMAMKKSVIEDQEEVNLYISLNNSPFFGKCRKYAGNQ